MVSTQADSPQQCIRVSVDFPIGHDSDGHEVTVIVTPKRPPRPDVTGAPTCHDIQPMVLIPNAATSTTPPIVYDSEEEDVFGQIKPANSEQRGRKEKRWYVITRGRKVGVFFKFWADIEHFVKENKKIIKGAVFSGCRSKEDAIAKYSAAADDGDVAVI